MKTFLICLVVFMIGAGLTLETLHEGNGKFLLVRNTGPADIAYGMMVYDRPYTANTDERVVGAGKISWMLFDAALRGPVQIKCRDGAGLTWLAPDPPVQSALLVSYLSLESCAHVGRRMGFTF